MNLPGRILDKLRRAAGAAPVRERVLVKTIDSARRKPLKPGFIIGVYRSGTTLLRYVLDSHPHIAVPPESNFLNGVAALWGDEWYRKGLLGVGVDDDGLRQRLKAFAGDIFDDYARAKGKRRWFDKTPSYVDILPALHDIFGAECRYIMLYRHGLDVANSMATMHGNDVERGPARRFAERFPASARLTNACYWAEQCEKMLAFEAAHPEQCFRIHYEDYSSEPARYLPPLFEFLGEAWDPTVLEFYARQHDHGLQDFKAAESTGFVPNTGSYRGWPQGEIDQAGEAVGVVLAKLGYTV